MRLLGRLTRWDLTAASILTLQLLAVAASSAEDKPAANAAQQKVDTTQGPTVIRPRITLIDEYTRLPDNDYRNRILLQGTIGLGEHKDYGLTVEIPYAQYEPASKPGEVSASGLGDIRTFLIHSFHVSGPWVQSWALETYFNTASERPALGSGSTTVLPGYAITYRASKTFQAILLAQYEFDVEREDGLSPTRRLAIRPFFIIGFPKYWYSFIEGKGVFDLENDDRFTLTGTASLGKFVGEKRKVAVFGLVGGPLNRNARDNLQRYQFKVGMNYFF